MKALPAKAAVFAELPHKFEAGTVNGGGAWGLKAAIDYLNSIGFEAIEEKENALTALAMEELQKIPHVHVIGSQDPKEHNGILNFTVDGVLLTTLLPFWTEHMWMCVQVITAHSLFWHILE